MDVLDPGKLKVVELRQELSQRGLDSKGNKAALVERLQKALEEETGQVVPKASFDSTEESTDYPTNSEIEETHQEEQQMQSEDYYQGEQDEGEPEAQEQYEQEDSQQSIQQENEDSQQSNQQEGEESQYNPHENEVSSQQDDYSMSQEFKEKLQEQKSDQLNGQTEFYTDENAQDQVNIKQEKENYEMDVDIKKEQIDEVKQEDNKDDVKVEIKSEADSEVKQAKDNKEFKSNDRKRKRSPSPAGRSSPQQQIPRSKRELEPEYDESAVLLSWYDSDLNFVIDKDDGFTKGAPMYKDGFAYIWAGARSTYGYDHGKVCYEVKLVENCDVSHLEDEPNPNVMRIGWSVDTTSMQLGEHPLSYGYGGTGKASTDCKFKNYGKPYVVGDVVTAYLDYETTPEHVLLSFAVNGEDQGVAYDVEIIELQGKALFPHLLTKNIGFEVNFGQLESPWFPSQEGFTWASQVPLEERIAGPKRPAKKSDCEAIMMCGLPGCGKTTWANEYVEKNDDKKFNILGTNSLIDKMKLMGLPRKRNYAGRWDVLIDKSTKCLNKLLQEAYMRRRNYIIDQTNVYPSAQKRKMRNYEGFIRRAVVIVPTDEEFQKRVAKREAEEGKDVPDSAVLEMKANFKLPEKGDIFSEVTYVELDEAEAKKLVEKYNKEAKDAGFGQNTPKPPSSKRFKREEHRPFRGGGGGGYGPRSHHRGGPGGPPGGLGGGKGFDRRDRHNGKPPFRRSGPPPPPLMGRSRGMDRRGPPGGGDRWSSRGPPGGGMQDRWRDRNLGGGGGGGRYGGNDRGPGGMGGGGGWRNNNGPGGRMGGGGGGGGGGGRNDFNERPMGGRMGGGGGGGGFDRGNRGPPPPPPSHNQHNRNRENKPPNKKGGGGNNGPGGGGGGPMGGGSNANSGPPSMQAVGNQNQTPSQNQGNQQGGNNTWGNYTQGQQGWGGWGQQANYGQSWPQNYQQTQQQQQQSIGGYGQATTGYNQQQTTQQQQQTPATGYNQAYGQGYNATQNPYANWQQQQQYYNQQYGQNWSQGWQGYPGYGYGANTNTNQQPPQTPQQPAAK